MPKARHRELPPDIQALVGGLRTITLAAICSALALITYWVQSAGFRYGTLSNVPIPPRYLATGVGAVWGWTGQPYTLPNASPLLAPALAAMVGIGALLSLLGKFRLLRGIDDAPTGRLVWMSIFSAVLGWSALFATALLSRERILPATQWIPAHLAAANVGVLALAASGFFLLAFFERAAVAVGNLELQERVQSIRRLAVFFVLLALASAGLHAAYGFALPGLLDRPSSHRLLLIPLMAVTALAILVALLLLLRIGFAAGFTRRSLQLLGEAKVTPVPTEFK